jgi:hypothetical protein
MEGYAECVCGWRCTEADAAPETLARVADVHTSMCDEVRIRAARAARASAGTVTDALDLKLRDYVVGKIAGEEVRYPITDADRAAFEALRSGTAVHHVPAVVDSKFRDYVSRLRAERMRVDAMHLTEQEYEAGAADLVARGLPISPRELDRIVGLRPLPVKVVPEREVPGVDAAMYAGMLRIWR